MIQGDLALNNLQWLIYHKTKPSQTNSHYTNICTCVLYTNICTCVLYKYTNICTCVCTHMHKKYVVYT